MITVTLTTTQGTEKKMSFDQLAQVRTFVDNLPKRLNKSTRVRVDCDLLGLNGAVIIEGAGVSAGLPFAISEAGNAIGALG